MKQAILLLFSLVLILPSLKAQEESFSSHSSVDLNGNLAAPIITERIVLSDLVSDNFKIFISLPEHYDSFRAEKYPVVYFLDGGSATFHNITAEYMKSTLIPEVITIGIGYPGASQRNRDYTYGYLNFYHFLKEELIPQIDVEFNTDPLKRTLFGHSYGGIFASLTMFQYNDYDDILFRNLIAASPSIWWPDGQLAYTWKSLLYSQTQILPVNLYMTVVSMEGSMVTDLERMQQVLENRNYEYFNLYSKINEGKDHSTNKELTFREGIRWILFQDVQIPYQTNAGDQAQNQIGVIAFPNPVNGVLKVRLYLLKSESSKIEFVNCSGKTFFQATTNEPELNLDVSRFPKGLYLLKIMSKEFLSTNKIILN